MSIPPFWGDVGVKKLPPFSNFGIRSPIFGHLKTGTFAKSGPFRVPKNGTSVGQINIRRPLFTIQPSPQNPQKDTLGTRIGPWKVIFGHFVFFWYFYLIFPLVRAIFSILNPTSLNSFLDFHTFSRSFLWLKTAKKLSSIKIFPFFCLGPRPTVHLCLFCFDHPFQHSGNRILNIQNAAEWKKEGGKEIKLHNIGKLVSRSEPQKCKITAKMYFKFQIGKTGETAKSCKSLNSKNSIGISSCLIFVISVSFYHERPKF